MHSTYKKYFISIIHLILSCCKLLSSVLSIPKLICVSLILGYKLSDL